MSDLCSAPPVDAVASRQSAVRELALPVPDRLVISVSRFVVDHAVRSGLVKTDEA